jgi:hypothetical protein
MSAVSTGGVFELVEHALESGLEAALFCWSQLVRNDKACEAHKSFMDLFQASLKNSGGGRTHRIRQGLCPHDSQRRFEKLASVWLISHTIR